MTAPSELAARIPKEPSKVSDHSEGEQPSVAAASSEKEGAQGSPKPPVNAGVEYLSTKKFIPVFASIYLTLFLVGLDRLIIATAIPTITNDFHSLGDLEWYASAYLLTGSAFILVFGRLYGFYSPKWVFVICIFIFEIGSAICGAAPNSTAFIWGRAIAGLGSAGAFSGAIVIVVFTVPMHKRPLYTGLLASSFALASVFGPLIGGVFTSSTATWRWCFYINLPIGGAAIIVISFILPNIPTPNGGTKGWKAQLANLDPLGTILFVPSIVCLILALQWGGSQYSWNDGRVIALLVVFAVTLVAFVGVQIWKGESATVPPRIICMRTMISATWYSFCNYSAFMVIVYFLPVWFQAIQGVSALESGIRTIPLVLSVVVFSIIAGAAVRFLGYYVPFMLACSIIGSIGAGMLSTLHPDSSESIWIGYQVLYGGGMGLGMQQAQVAAQTTLSKRDIAVGSAVITFAQQLGGAIFVAVGQSLLNQRLISGFSGIPGFDAASITGTGATDLRKLIQPKLLPRALDIYNDAIMLTMKLAIALSAAGVVGSLCIEWNTTKQEQIDAEKAKKENEAGGV